MPSGCVIGAGVIACAEVATAKAKPAAAINLIILLLPYLRYSFQQGKDNPSIIQAKSDYKSSSQV
jgi:hypothetical protein